MNLVRINTEMAFSMAKAGLWSHADIALRMALTEANRAKERRTAGKLIRAIQAVKIAAKKAA